MSGKRIIAPGDAQSLNFREICMGSIAPGTLYRSSHPIQDNKMVISNENLRTITEYYLGNTIGLTAEEIDLLKRKLAGI